eukprot:m51a1_g11281 hypothetical protein (481) ;mRNA; r:17317-19180
MGGPKAAAGPKVVPIKVERMGANEVSRTVFRDVAKLTASAKLDRSTLRTLFTASKTAKVKSEKKVEIVYCLSQQRRQNIDMFLRKNKIDTETLRNVLLDPPQTPRAEDAEIFERLAELLTLRAGKGEADADPDREEKMMRAFEPKSAFSKPEQFVYDLYQIPRVRQKLVGVGLRAQAEGLFETAAEDAALVLGTLDQLATPSFQKIMAYLVEITREVGKGTAWERTAGFALSALSDIVNTKLQSPTDKYKTLADWVVAQWQENDPEIIKFSCELLDKVTATAEALKRFEIVFPQALECLLRMGEICECCSEPAEERYKATMTAFLGVLVQRLEKCAAQLDEIDTKIIRLGDNKAPQTTCPTLFSHSAEPVACLSLKTAIAESWSRITVPEEKKTDLGDRVQRDFLRYAFLHGVEAFLTTVKAVADRNEAKERDRKQKEARQAAAAARRREKAEAAAAAAAAAKAQESEEASELGELGPRR